MSGDLDLAAGGLLSDVDLSTVDLTDAKWHLNGPPYELFARMRAQTPVRWNPLPDGTGAWSLTRHEDIAAVSRDTATFSSHRAGIFLHPDQVVPLELTRNLLLYKDPPEHTKYRLILQTAFTPRTVLALEDAVRARVVRAIDRVIESGACDFASDIAVPVPLEVLGDLMGVPDSDIPRFGHWTEEIEAAQRSPEPGGAVEVFGEMAVYLASQIERQARRGESDSLVMRLSRAEVDGQRLNDSEILVFFGLLAFAGNDTTRNTAATGMLALLQHPRALAELRERPDLIPAAVEEVLRYTSVVKYFVRSATRACEIAGQEVAEGDRVILWYCSASRDEEANERAESFDIHRSRVDHMAFGGGGRHFCLGAGLARLELRILFEEVLRRMEGIEQVRPAERLPSSWANGLLSLPLGFQAGPREA
jgi:cytochrome P450